MSNLDLFESTFSDTETEAHQPLAVRMRPRTVDELLGQERLLTPGSPLLRLLTPTSATDSAQDSSHTLPGSVLLWGPAGTGKTTIAHLIARNSDRHFAELSAIHNGIKDVRDVIASAKRDLIENGIETILFIDEIHRFSKAQQDALLPAVENRTVVLVAATTENPSFSIIGPLISRSLVLRLEPLTEEDLLTCMDRAISSKGGLAKSVNVPADVKRAIIRLSYGDVRHMLTILEAAAGVALNTANKRDAKTSKRVKPKITLEILQQVANVATVKYDRDGDEHYDVISAFIKSMRGSDVDAALHYLARMVAAGEDPRFIARRIMIAASEEIAMADPTALLVTSAAANVVEKIGFPEAGLTLAQAVTHICMAPKSNAVTVAWGGAQADVAAGLGGPVPKHLRDAHYKTAKNYGHGIGYKYAHDFPHSIAQQQYLPDDLANDQYYAEYYKPTDHGRESHIREMLAKIKAILRGK